MRHRILIGCSGSVATVKVPELVAELCVNFEVIVIASQSSLHFIERSKEYNKEAWKKFELINGLSLIFTDKDEWENWNKLGDSVIHIELRKWADILLIAPASANLLSKAAIGSCDNLLLSVMRAWDFSKPCVLCPAMNTVMWDHPITVDTLHTLKFWGWKVLGPVEKLLACNERGNGAMISVKEIVDYVDELKVADNNNKEVESINVLLKQRAAHGIQLRSPTACGIGNTLHSNMLQYFGVGVCVGMGFFVSTMILNRLIKR